MLDPRYRDKAVRRMHPNSANLFHGRPPLSEIYSDLILARLMPSGAVHTNRNRFSATPACRGTTGAETQDVENHSGLFFPHRFRLRLGNKFQPLIQLIETKPSWDWKMLRDLTVN